MMGLYKSKRSVVGMWDSSGNTVIKLWTGQLGNRVQTGSNAQAASYVMIVWSFVLE
jgi:hypothetical protein